MRAPAAQSLKVQEAARRLNVSPSTLRAWEHRFGFPAPERSPGGHRRYRLGEIVALRDALDQGLSISSAILRVRGGDAHDADALAVPLGAFETDRAGRIAEAALAIRSLERAVEEVLLPALERVRDRHGLDSAQWAFAIGWASDWLRWSRRLAISGGRPLRLLVGDATGGPLDPDGAYAAALELFVARAGGELLATPVSARRGIAEAVQRLRPEVAVVAGAAVADAEVARWMRAVRAGAGPLPAALFRREPGGRVAGVVLDPSPLVAHRQVLALTEAGATPSGRHAAFGRARAVAPAAAGASAL